MLDRMLARAAKMRINISSAIAKMIAIYEIHINTSDFAWVTVKPNSHQAPSSLIVDTNGKRRKQPDIDKKLKYEKKWSICKFDENVVN